MLHGKHYTEFIDQINQLEKEEKWEEVEKLLLEIIEVMEKSALQETAYVAPAFYSKLAKIYQKTKQKDKQIKILNRLLIQPNSGSSTAKESVKYLKLLGDLDEDEIKNKLYREYLEHISKSALKTSEKKCYMCGKTVRYLVPKGAEMFRGFCPLCHSSDIIQGQ